MKLLLVAEQRQNRLQESIYELLAFAQEIGADPVMFLVGSEEHLPEWQGSLYLADVEKYGEFNPDIHKQLILDVVARESPELVLFSHGSYGWDLAPRLAFSLKAAQVSEVIGYEDAMFVVPACNGKLHRWVESTTAITVVTLQAGAYLFQGERQGVPSVQTIESTPLPSVLEFDGYETAIEGGVELSKAEVIVSVGRGAGSKEGIEAVKKLAMVLGGELAASRPVVDSGLLPYDRQVGSTGQIVSPKLYIACGISGAIQHVIGMKKSEFVVAINSDRHAPIAEVADLLVVADLKKILPVLTDKLQKRVG